MNRLRRPTPYSMRARAFSRERAKRPICRFRRPSADARPDAARPFRLAVRLAGVAFVADGGARLDVGSDVEPGFEVTRVGSFPAGLIHGDDVAGGVRFCVDFRGEADARTAERLPSCPFAGAADTGAHTIVQDAHLNGCAVGLIDAGVSKMASKMRAFLERSTRFHSLFPLEALRPIATANVAPVRSAAPREAAIVLSVPPTARRRARYPPTLARTIASTFRGDRGHYARPEAM